MVNFLILLIALALPVTSFSAVVPSGVPQFTFGGGSSTGSAASFSVTKDMLASTGAAGEYFFLEFGGGPTDGTCTPFRKNSVVYQAPANGTLCIMAIYTSGSSGQVSGLVSGTATFANNATCSGITGVKYQCAGTSGQYCLSSGATAHAPAVLPLMYKFDGSSYPGAQFLNPGSNTHQLRLLCKEL